MGQKSEKAVVAAAGTKGKKDRAAEAYASQEPKTYVGQEAGAEGSCSLW